ncbi:MAG: telomerase inhibitor [Chaenotheca gracillima]|nr:MAG: telomerase inhibitor [Chaenotheca gracillima]
MPDENVAPAPVSPPSPTVRRASFSPGQSLSNIFSRSPTNSTNQGNNNAFPGSIASAAANVQNRRRMSINTLGLSSSMSGSPPGQTSPFGSASRRGSISSAGTNSASLDESVIEEGDAPANTPSTPFARRMSFGARALRDVRQGNGNGNNANGRSSISYNNHNNTNSTTTTNSASSPTLKARGRGNEGFNWSENLRSRAERTSSISNGGGAPAAPAPQAFSGNNASAQLNHQRAKSVAIPPAQEARKEQKAPDHFQERILKGDFYMD